MDAVATERPYAINSKGLANQHGHGCERCPPPIETAPVRLVELLTEEAPYLQKDAECAIVERDSEISVGLRDEYQGRENLKVVVNRNAAMLKASGTIKFLGDRYWDLKAPRRKL